MGQLRKIIALLVAMLLVHFSAWAQNHQGLKLDDEESTTLVILPDPQNYIKFDTNQPIFELMTAWIVSQAEPLNIAAVICTGDLVEQNNWVASDGVNGNQTSEEQWESVSRSFSRLDNRLPYFISPGNHDYGYKNGETRETNYTKYFPLSKNHKNKKHLVATYTNSMGQPTLENAVFELKIPNWGDFLMVTTEFGPRDEVLTWIKEFIAKEEYKEHMVILLTHSYLRSDGALIVKENYKMPEANYGQQIWDKLVYPSQNIRMVICGHYALIGGYEKNVGYREDINVAGKKVAQMMFNAQTLGGGWHGNGGDGWLRTLEFMPDGETIAVKTYSPLFGYSELTADLANREADFDHFSITLQK